MNVRRVLGLSLALLGTALLALVLAQPLSEAQYQALNTDITVTNQAEFAQDVLDNNDVKIANAYKLIPVTTFWVKRTSVRRGEYLFGTSPDGTVFTFVGNGFITRASGEIEAWKQLFSIPTQGGGDTTNPSLTTVVQAFQDIFSGTGNAQANRTHLAAMSRRNPNRGERLFVDTSGGQVGTTAAPARLVFEGELRSIDVAHALRQVPLP